MMIACLRNVLAICIVVTMTTLAVAQTKTPDESLTSFAEEAERIGALIDQGTLETSRIEDLRANIEERRKRLVEIAASTESDLAPLKTRMEALGPAPESGEEPSEIAAQRAELQAEIDRLDSLRKRAEEAATRATSVVARLTELQRTRFAQQLLQRGPSPLNPERAGLALSAVERQAHAIGIEVDRRLSVGDAMQSLVDRLALPLLLAVMALFLAIAARRFLVGFFQRKIRPDASRTHRIGVATGITLTRLLLPSVGVALLLTAALQSGLAGPTGLIYLKALVQGAMIVIGAYALGGAFFAPGMSEVRLSRLGDDDARRAHRWMVFLAIVIALDRVLVRGSTKAGLTIDGLSVLNAGLLVLGAIALWRFAKIARIGRPREDADTPEQASEDDPMEEPPGLQPLDYISRFARLATRLICIASPLLALAGYYAASRFIFYPFVFSGALIGLCILIQTVAQEVSGSRRDGQGRKDEGEKLSFLPVMTGFILALGAIPILALIWGASLTDLDAAWQRIIEGFEIGEVTLAPADFIVFAIVFSIGYLLTRVLKGVMRRSVLPLTRMDEGAKSALLAGIGYIGITVSALIAISTTGLDLSNLAIVAGALSVGIGFGLQNIVNNFVSGIILLIERPIKTGDWVEISGVHGTVRQVNVRSTEIQTFDRSTMFVPNADLISGTVTNWTHSDSYGRLIVPIGVAYGSDARQVEKILLEIAQAHPMLMRRPAPYVIFSGFGADSIDFEIRGVLRDVNWILNVASDIRFSVYERFTQEGIEIPFAQRDVHVRGLGGLEKLIGERPKGPREEEFPEVDTDAGSGDGAPPGEGPDAD